MKPLDLSFLHGEHRPLCQIHVDKHLKGHYSLQFMEKGGLELAYDENLHSLEGSWFWPAYPGPRIRFHAGAGHAFWNHRYIAFKGPLMNQWIADGLYPMTPQKAPDRETAIAYFDEILRCFRRFDRWSQRKVINLLERILIDLAEARHESRTSEPWLGRTMEMLDKSAGFTVDYDQLAAGQGMSLTSLRRKFRLATGISIHRYGVQVRMTRARHRLVESSLPIKTVAEELGYSDVCFFSRQFKKETGITPAAFRKSRQT